MRTGDTMPRQAAMRRRVARLGGTLALAGLAWFAITFSASAESPSPSAAAGSPAPSPGNHPV